tara:strand:+ start:254 stop:817 length:564 start_codon:yes stop_codon:yes gene_type:complete
MKEKIDLRKSTYQKTSYPTIINTQFNELGTISVNEQIESTTTVAQFFELYNELFYEIPSFGDINSHQFLIDSSAEYIDYNANQEEITALRAEITDLRRQLLESQIATAEALSGEKIDLNTDLINNETLANNEEFAEILRNLGDIPTSPTEENTTADTVVANSPVNVSSTSAPAPAPSGGGGGGGGGY